MPYGKGGIGVFSIGLYTDFVDLPDVADLGYDYLELPLDALAALPEADFRDFSAYVDGKGIPVAACSRLLPEDLPITGANVNATALHGYLAHAMGRARRLGVRTLALDAAASRNVPEGGDFPFAFRQLGNFLRLIQGHARECGMTVALVPLRKADCSLLNLVSEATLIAGLLQLSNVAVAAHWGHMSMASEPMSALRRAAPLLKHAYLENALEGTLPRPGDGEDYGRMLHTLKDIGYCGGVTLCGTIGEGFARDAKAALEYITDEVVK